MMRKIVFIICLVVNFVSLGQSLNYSNEYPSGIAMDVLSVSRQIYNNIPIDKKTKLWDSPCHVFATTAAYEIADLMYNNRIYNDKPEYVDYLTKILKQITPKELVGDTNVKVFLVADGSVNAFCLPNGYICVDIGLLTFVPNEATLASILAHELAHYYLHHSLQAFIDYQSGASDYGFGGTSKRMLNRYSSKSELSADSLSLIWLKNSDYNISNVYKCFELLSIIENKFLSKQEVEIKNTSKFDHPLSAKRAENIKYFYNKYKADSGSNFLISEALFNKCKKEFRTEALKYLLEDGNYDECIETAFAYHIFDPTNVEIIRYMLDGIRKFCFFDETLWNKNFITYNFFENTPDNKRSRIKESFFEIRRYDLIGLTLEDFNNCKAKFYWDNEPKFKTYEESFNYFYKLSQVFHDKESILINALSYTKDTISRNIFLRKYLLQEGILYKDYAITLLHDSLRLNLPSKSMLVLVNFKSEIKLSQDNIPIATGLFNDEDLFSKLIDTIAKAQHIDTSIFLPEVHKNNLSDYYILCKIVNYSFNNRDITP